MGKLLEVKPPNGSVGRSVIISKFGGRFHIHAPIGALVNFKGRTYNNLPKNLRWMFEGVNVKVHWKYFIYRYWER